MTATAKPLIAVDIGNSRIKIGYFGPPPFSEPLPVPSQTLEVPLENRDGDYDIARVKDWAEAHANFDADWLISYVQSGALVRLLGSIQPLARQLERHWSLGVIANDEVPLAIDVEHPEHVGTDRLMAALAANRLRDARCAAIVVGIGTAITVDLVNSRGVFCGGAILPGMAMAAQALEEQTDGLPHVSVDHWTEPPAPLGRATEPAIESGLFWGTVGAVRELIEQYSKELSAAPEVILSGGASQLVARVLSEACDLRVRHVPNLVMAGIALVAEHKNAGKPAAAK